jgi:hypothetical protein
MRRERQSTAGIALVIAEGTRRHLGKSQAARYGPLSIELQSAMPGEPCARS